MARNVAKNGEYLIHSLTAVAVLRSRPLARPPTCPYPRISTCVQRRRRHRRRSRRSKKRLTAMTNCDRPSAAPCDRRLSVERDIERSRAEIDEGKDIVKEHKNIKFALRM